MPRRPGPPRRRPADPVCGFNAGAQGREPYTRRYGPGLSGFASVRDLYHCGRRRHNWHYVVPTWRSHLLASMAHRVAKGLVGGCALLLGVTVTGCGAPQYTYVANSSESTYFKVPNGWHKIDGSALQRAMEAVLGSAGGGWQVAYEAGRTPTANDF